ncbi:MAG: IS110 family transposase [Magnetococcus sp. YQC-3]
MNVKTIGVDLAKNFFQIHGVDAQGKVVLRKKVSRDSLLPSLANVGPALVGMEACAGAHYWAKEIEKLGHTVRIMNPAFVAPYIKNQKNDANDAEGICEAVSRPNMRFVPIKSFEQQDMQSLHRIREQLTKQRTAMANQIRGLLGEYGYVIPKGIGYVSKRLPDILADPACRLTETGHWMFTDLLQRFTKIQEHMETIGAKIKEAFAANESCQALSAVKGIGVLTATAVMSALGNVKEFKNGRQFAAWIGLVPKQNSSGGKTRLLGITKRGNRYLRWLFVHGARSALHWEKDGKTPLARWLTALEQRVGNNRAVVALANKNARIAWALIAKGVPFDPAIAYQPK